MRVEAPGEILDQAENVGHPGAGLDLLARVAGQLPELNVLELELALGVAVGQAGAPQGREEGVLLGGGPAAQPVVKIREGHAVRGLVAAFEGPVKVVEAVAQGGLRPH